MTVVTSKATPEHELLVSCPGSDIRKPTRRKMTRMSGQEPDRADDKANASPVPRSAMSDGCYWLRGIGLGMFQCGTRRGRRRLSRARVSPPAIRDLQPDDGRRRASERSRL